MSSNAAIRATAGCHVDAPDRLIVALDFDDVESAYSLVDSLNDTATAYKVGYHLLFIPGYDRLIDDLIERGKRVFLDAKLCDITDTARAGVAGAVRRKVHFLTIHGNGDVSDAALKAAVETRGDSPLKLLLVTVLTSIDNLVLQATGQSSTVMEEVEFRTKRALRFGFDGVICSGHEASLVRQLSGRDDFIIATPGIRPTGSQMGDQRRVMTPSEAITSGADYLIIGRPIIKAENARFAAAIILLEMQTAFDTR